LKRKRKEKMFKGILGVLGFYLLLIGILSFVVLVILFAFLWVLEKYFKKHEINDEYINERRGRYL
jgi:uncharacterized membrane protein